VETDGRSLDARSLRRALLRGAFAVAVALLPSLVAGRLLAIPPSVALVVVPLTLLELGWENVRAPAFFAVATLLLLAAFLNGAYFEGVLRGGSIDAGLVALDRSLGGAAGKLPMYGTVLLAAQMLALAFTLSNGVKDERLLLGPPFVGAQVGALMIFDKPTVAPAAGLVVTLLATAVTFTLGAIISVVYVAADAAERRLWPEAAS
jgi:hypothetical protein